MKRKVIDRNFEYESSKSSKISSIPFDLSQWQTVRAYIEPAPTLRGEVGWICPVCGRGLAPSMSWCPCNVGTSASATVATSATPTMTLDEIEEYDWTMTIPVDDVSRSVD